MIRPQLMNINTKLDVVQSPDQIVNRPDIVNPTQRRETMRIQNATVPPQKTFVQPVIQYVINENETHHVHSPVFKRVPYLKRVTVPTTVLQKVPVVKKLPVPVKTRAEAFVKSREYGFNLNPIAKASTGFVERRSYALSPEEQVPIEVRGGKAVWELSGQNAGADLVTSAEVQAVADESDSDESESESEAEAEAEVEAEAQAEAQAEYQAEAQADAQDDYSQFKLNDAVFQSGAPLNWELIGRQ